MAYAAILCGRQVIGRFAQGGNTIVAGGAVTHDTRVIEYAGGKTTNAMADAAIFGRGNVRVRLAASGNTVVA